MIGLSQSHSRLSQKVSGSEAVIKDGASVRLVAGEFDEVRGPVTEIAASPLYLEVSLGPASSLAISLPLGHTALAYVFEGAGRFGDDQQVVEAVRMVVFDDGERVEAQSEVGMRFMLIAGAPFREPIVPYGPFVMNTAEEIRQALTELRNGTFIK